MKVPANYPLKSSDAAYALFTFAEGHNYKESKMR